MLVCAGVDEEVLVNVVRAAASAFVVGAVVMTPVAAQCPIDSVLMGPPSSAAIVRELPGFAGIYRDTVIRVLVTDTSVAARAEVIVRRRPGAQTRDRTGEDSLRAREVFVPAAAFVAALCQQRRHWGYIGYRRPGERQHRLHRRHRRQHPSAYRSHDHGTRIAARCVHDRA